MSNLIYENLINLFDNYYFLSNCSSSQELINSNTIVICFDDNFDEKNYLHFLNNNLVSKFILLSQNKPQKNNKLTYFKKINNRFFNGKDSKILILINPTNDYQNAKYIVSNLIKLFKLYSLTNKSSFYNHNDCKIICSFTSNDSIYYNDILNSIHAILLDEKRLKYEFIYDTVCDYLDDQFNKCNLCDFKNDQCVANRSGCISHTVMGCCYSFEYTRLFDFRLVKNIKVCQYQQNRTCTTKNIGCKLFTCSYLKKQNIKFDINKILLLDCFFNKKQKEVIQVNYFKTREEILDKLLEKNHDLYFWYALNRKYFI